ncbi:M15 family metallopeptidase [Inquilinus sp. OTU3971]|uniref:M15 family metallopeptidase n=1 Tax=Inquilinus sp. OTU3971 TaxID=3043855 RepID=UPI00313F0C0E
MNASFTPLEGSVTTTARLNIRARAPMTTSSIARKVDAGASLPVRGVVSGEIVLGNARWYAGPNDTFFWSGACSSFQPANFAPPTSAATGLNVDRRPDGTILPLSDAKLRSVFGDFPYTEGSKGRINIDPTWVQQNIIEIATPILADAGYPKITIHREAADGFKAAFDRIAAANLSHLILSCAGTFVPRHKGWDPNRGLSSHSWGVAIDLNVAWNGYGAEPAPFGTHGSVRELVPHFEAEGFAWGGYFSPPYQDGMHFELARKDL